MIVVTYIDHKRHSLGYVESWEDAANFVVRDIKKRFGNAELTFTISPHIEDNHFLVSLYQDEWLMDEHYAFELLNKLDWS